jgi:hypothetical protein
MDADAQLQLEPHLRAGERLLWCGRPDPLVRLTPVDGFLIPFSILWTSFAIFWEIGVSTSGSPAAAVFGVPFLAIGGYLVFGRFLYKSYRKKRTFYGITAQRAMIFVTPGTLTDIPLLQQPASIRRSRDGRHASVVIGPAPVPRRSGFLRTRSTSWAYYANTGTEPLARGVVMPFAFYDVADGDAMLSALDQARAGQAA